jgi:hypothetical protein
MLKISATACQFDTLAYAIDYKLPDGADKYLPVADQFDLKMWLRRALFIQDPEACQVGA